MYFRLLSLLLIACVLVSQLARAPHAHPGMGKAEKSKHDETPHVHLAGHSHSHSHGHSHNHNQSSDESEEPINGGFNSTHDSHSLAFAVDISPAKTQINFAEVELSFLLVVVSYLGCEKGDQTRLSRFDRPPDLPIFDCSDTYLKLRQLRI